jgi:hypothetical protein
LNEAFPLHRNLLQIAGGLNREKARHAQADGWVVVGEYPGTQRGSVRRMKLNWEFPTDQAAATCGDANAVRADDAPRMTDPKEAIDRRADGSAPALLAIPEARRSGAVLSRSRSAT